MRRAVVASAATASGLVLLLSLKPHRGAAAITAPITSNSTSASSTSGSSGLSGGSAPASAARSVTGDAAETRFGPVQVKITLSGKKITDIAVVQYPTDNPRDQEINSYALPMLNQEAIAAQSAQIDVVSGATFTSQGYQQSLQSAIDKAGL